MSTPWERIPWQQRNDLLIRATVQPAVRFMRIEAAGGLTLVVGALAGLIWVNVAGASYHDVWETVIVLDLSIVRVEEHLVDWVNDGLMTIFFFVVALEIKRELVHGELSTRQRASLPVMAALGGMIVPALIFVAFNAGREGGSGWAIPVATDIAFAVGVLSLLGRRVPLQLKIFLLALAVADDVGGILIIAVFYTDDLALDALGIAFAVLVGIWAMQRVGIRSVPAYAVVGVALWLATLESGVVATIAGVVLGLITPARSLYTRERFEASLRRYRDRFRAAMSEPDSHVRNESAGMVLGGITELSRETESPLERLEAALTPWSSFVVVPIFALANAGIELGGGAIPDALENSVAWGVALGLVLGKVVGVTLFSYLAVRIGVATLPSLVGWRQITGVALLAGIGFTVSIFIATLSYDDPGLIQNAKIGIFAASVFAAVVGYFYLRRVMRAPEEMPEGGAAEPPAAAASPR